MSNIGETFFTTVGCMDGRAQGPVVLFGQKKFCAQYGDTITETGLVGLISKKNPNTSLLNSLKKKISISLEKHHAKGIVVSGHEECAGNPVEDSRQKKDILKAAKVIERLVLKKAKVLPVFVKRPSAGSGLKTWIVEEL